MLSELGFSNGDHGRKCVIRNWRSCCVKTAGREPAGYEVASACSEEGWRELAQHEERGGWGKGVSSS